MEDKALAKINGESSRDNIRNSGALETIIDVADATLNSVATFAAPIPALKILFSAAKLAKGMRDDILKAKIAKFIEEAQSCVGEKLLFSADVIDDEETQAKTGEHLLFLLERLDDLDKIPFVAKCFVAFLRGKVSFDDYRRLIGALDKCFMPDIKYISSKKLDEYLKDRQIIDTLASAGLLEISSIPQVKGEGAQTKYALTRLGNLFVDYLLKA